MELFRPFYNSELNIIAAFVNDNNGIDRLRENTQTNAAAIITAEVKRDHCNKTVDIYEDVSSPEVTPESIGRPMTCWYRFRSFRGTPRDWILRIRFKKFKVGTLLNATTCHMGYLQVRHNICYYIHASLLASCQSYITIYNLAGGVV
ncbi:uncharacterized protein CBL_09357 [Carabus blaptoides fortunei]